uniref:Similar to Callose synthase 3 n=1 Tax=Arundo donax TaxID=35708 RepID=A0A0A9DCU8_ARUDO
MISFFSLAPFCFLCYGIVNGSNNFSKKSFFLTAIGWLHIFTRQGTHISSQHTIHFKCHMMIYVANAFRHKPQVCSFAPNEKVQTHIQYFSLLHLLLNCWQPEAALATKIFAPLLVVLE